MVHAFSIAELAPSKNELVAMANSDVGWLILCTWNNTARHVNPMAVADFCEYQFKGPHPIYDQGARADVEPALVEGWIWLENEGLLVPDLRYSSNFAVRVRSRAATKLVSQADWEAFKQGRLLPIELLHPAIRGKIWSTWARGDHDAAVFQSFKELEIFVRQKCELPSSNENLGVRLMRKVFDKKNGRLTDIDSEEGERQALSDLFAGAIGSYKNPHSHRRVEISASEASEMIILASHLLKIVEART